MVVPGGVVVSYERGSPVHENPPTPSTPEQKRAHDKTRLASYVCIKIQTRQVYVTSPFQVFGHGFTVLL